MLRRNMEVEMARFVERLIARLMGPLADELARMPPEAFRHLLAGR